MSPFFRAWFGDWRAYDMSKVEAYKSNNSKFMNNIKISPIAVSQVYKPADTIDDIGGTTSDIIISQLFDFVKTYDKSFKPKPVNPIVLNEDGTPKVFCHG